jgi:hypothetical protein
LNEIGELAVQDLAKRLVHALMVSPDCKYAKAAQEIEVFCAGAIPEILPLAKPSP